MSPEFEEKLWQESLNQQSFTKGKKGHENSFVHMFSDTNVPLHMVIGRVDAYETLHGEELTMLDHDFCYLCNLQRDFLRE